ncbi:zinc-dependent alcohol dehydrogenase [Phytoactinopolyspora halophila]|uniref:zinc-dependent alcohol dehydrogenase n=1 Tax=Phytoactinopolyspora halophila TaxID=1981511 RepID=UPI001FE6166E|nr:alcohol dehydrogenase catalytic domain-containing protein [Phytoactinopolyspora halophila]
MSDVPEPASDGRAVVAPATMGLCGTDVKILAGSIPVDTPRILGHEIVGRVVRPGPARRVDEGQRVLIDPGIACGHCRLCRADRPHLCPHGALMGRDVDGGFGERVAVDEFQLHPIPDELSTGDASLLQVLGTCVHAQTRVADVFPGQTAAVVGLGVSGLLHLQLLRERGVDRIVAVTRSAWKRELAERWGAIATASPGDAGDVLDEVTGGAGADLVVETAGSASTLARSIELAAMGATVLAFGTAPSGPAELPLYQLYYKELDVVNARAARPRDYTRAIQLATSGRLHLRDLWSADFPLDDAAAAVAAARDSSTLKVTMTLPG